LIYDAMVGIHVNGWVKQKSAPIQGWRELPQVAANVRNFLEYIGSSFNEQWWLYFGPVLLLLGLVCVVVGVRYALSRRGISPAWSVALIGIGSLLMPFISLALALGPLLLLADPPVAPRVLVGMGALLVTVLLVMESAMRKWQHSSAWTLSVAAMLAVGMCVFASAYGNALEAQRDYEERIATRLADDINDLSVNHAVNAILLAGSAGYAPETAHIIEEFPLVASLTPPYLAADDTFHTHVFLQYYLPVFNDLRLRSDDDSERLKASLLVRACEATPLHIRNAYSLYVMDETAVVLLGPSAAQRCLTTGRM
jgi:hypothetical protein